MAENALTKLPLAGQLGVAALLALVIGIGFYTQQPSGVWNIKPRFLSIMKVIIIALA